MKQNVNIQIRIQMLRNKFCDTNANNLIVTQLLRLPFCTNANNLIVTQLLRLPFCTNAIILIVTQLLRFLEFSYVNIRDFRLYYHSLESSHPEDSNESKPIKIGSGLVEI